MTVANTYNIVFVLIITIIYISLLLKSLHNSLQRKLPHER